jgi:hypothetical protein
MCSCCFYVCYWVDLLQKKNLKVSMKLKNIISKLSCDSYIILNLYYCTAFGYYINISLVQTEIFVIYLCTMLKRLMCEFFEGGFQFYFCSFLFYRTCLMCDPYIILNFYYWVYLLKLK